MSIENRQHGVDIKIQVPVLVNRVIDARKGLPGGPRHRQEMANLADLIANDSSALAKLKELQNE